MATPLKLRTALDAKFLPLPIIWKGKDPAITVVGEIEVRVGTGYTPTFTGKVIILETG